VVGGLLCRLYNAQYQGFADDVVLLQKFKLVSTLCDRIQGTLNCGENWFKEIGLSVNADMKIMVLFTNNKKIGDFYNPRRFGTELRMADQVKYLGVILDNMQYACISGPAIHFRGEARMLLSYASLVWWKRVELKNAQKRLSHLQRMTCLGITGGMRSTPSSALEVMIMLPPLHLIIKQEIRKAANGLLGNGCSICQTLGTQRS
jgi:hypothetical protein